MSNAEIAVLETILKTVRENQTSIFKRLRSIEKDQARDQVEQALWRGKLIGLSIAGSMLVSGVIAWLAK